MRFEEALKWMREGKKVRQKCYPQFIYWIEEDKIFEIHRGWMDEAKYFEPFEILAEDWEVVDEGL